MKPTTQFALGKVLAEAQIRRRERAECLPTTNHCTVALLQTIERLHEIGWRDACYAPKNRSFDAIVLGGSGIHRCQWLGGGITGGWFIEDKDDWWPAQIVVWREVGEVMV